MSSFPQSSNMPILSGPPPLVESSSCRQCAKSFNPLWARSTACGHCGYEYCSKCISDGQALMPRRAGQSSINAGPLDSIRDELGIGGSRNAGSGYEPEKVCTNCLGMLQVTAAPLDRLRTLPLKRLKDYLAAYDIPCVGPKEKEDFVQAVVKARNPATGCLRPEAESYYRRRSVPRATSTSSTPTNGSNTPSPRPPPPQARPPPPGAQYRPAQTDGSTPQYNTRPPPPTAPRQAPSSYPQRTAQSHYHQQARPTPPRPTPRPTPPPARASPAPAPAKPPPPPVPTILSLVSLPKSYLASLSIGTLKAILYENHVRVDFKQVLEKEELINRVDELIRDERKRLERQRIEEEREANGHAEALKPPTPPGEAEDGRASTDGTAKNVPTGPLPEVERGLCVVCQDEEATLAVVDCGHLAMCAHCSDLIMATSQECPLCRTRIVTPQRLIRIYRV